MAKFDNKIGRKYGRLTVIKRVDNARQPNGKTQVQWLCKCTCGKTIVVRSTSLNSGNTKSCGCAMNKPKHGLSKTRLYRIWNAMKNRCNNPNNYGYKNYGGRGIKVCDEWNKDFLEFYNWAINNGYKENLSIDRINNNGNYEPNNCRWATSKEQMANRRNFKVKNQYGVFGLRY